jgi:hypothetical protein
MFWDCHVGYPYRIFSSILDLIFLTRFKINDILSTTRTYISRQAAGTFSNSSMSCMKPTIECTFYDLEIKLINQFVEGDFVKASIVNTEYLDKFDSTYITNVIRWGSQGAFICQIQSKSELSRDNFVIVGWEVPIFGTPRTYSIVIDASDYKLKWDSSTLRNKHNSLCHFFMMSDQHVEEDWLLENDEIIKLTSLYYR